jgi:alkylated DNA repair dioxygenase AlkB
MELEHGSLLVMDGCSQRETQHAIPKTRKNKGLRINLTFRQVLGG